MAEQALQQSPARGKSRLESLDVLRGIAILGILYMNIFWMGSNFAEWMQDPRRLAWTGADQGAFSFMRVFLSGTQRGLFELLFGAGVLILTARALTPDGPVATADLYLRRNLWLVVFGLIDIFLIGWTGDILFYYGLAALVVFSFRRLATGALIACGLLYTVATVIGWPGGGGFIGNQARAERIVKLTELENRSQAGDKLGEDETKKLERWQQRQRALDPANPPEGKMKALSKANTKAHEGDGLALLGFNTSIWGKFFAGSDQIGLTIAEAACTMLLGMALWKLGIIQGDRTLRFYAGLMAACYVAGIALRLWNLSDVLSFTLTPKLSSVFHEPARLLMTLGHVGLINLLLKIPATKALLSPFKAAGRMAFTIYIATSIVCLWILFPHWGLNLWDRHGWAEMMVIATLVNLGMLIFANLWLRLFACGPLEWLWRSLSYCKLQDFRRKEGGSSQPTLPGLAPAAST